MANDNFCTSLPMNSNKFVPPVEPTSAGTSVYATTKPLTDAAIREFYVRGIFRNLFGVLSGIFGDEVNSTFTPDGNQPNSITNGNRDRGDFNFDLISYLFQSSKLRTVTKRLLKTLKSNKQGKVTYHDLALAHCLLCTLQYIKFGQHDRHADAITTSMAMGRMIRPVAEITALTFKKFSPSTFSQMSDAEIRSAFPQEHSRLVDAISEVEKANKKSKRLTKLEISVHRLIAAFAIIKSSGIDSCQPFEEFLGGRDQ